MTRWLRFVITGVFAFFRSKAVPPEEIRYTFWTWFQDADVHIVNNASLLSYTELGRLDFLIRSRLFFHLLREGIYFPSAATHMTFVRPLKRFQKLELRTKLIYWDPKWIWVEQNLYYRKNGESVLANRSIMRGTFRKGRLAIPFDEILKGIGIPLAKMEKPDVIAKLERVEI